MTDEKAWSQEEKRAMCTHTYAESERRTYLARKPWKRSMSAAEEEDDRRRRREEITHIYTYTHMYIMYIYIRTLYTYTYIRTYVTYDSFIYIHTYLITCICMWSYTICHKHIMCILGICYMILLYRMLWFRSILVVVFTFLLERHSHHPFLTTFCDPPFVTCYGHDQIISRGKKLP